jgi:hypothetical protein
MPSLSLLSRYTAVAALASQAVHAAVPQYVNDYGNYYPRSLYWDIRF